jgi:hypothetical protein
MDKKITQLTQVTELTGAELLPLAQGGVTKSASVDQLRGYKVYTALLTQSGGDDPQTAISAPLTIGVTYTIYDYYGSDDFTNVGAPNNNVGTSFVATGTTPNNWAGETVLAFNAGAPVVTVLENTIGNIWWTYDSAGKYIANSTNAFTNGGTWQLIENSGAGGSVTSSILYVNSNVIWVYSFDGGTQSDDILSNTPIEIRVYN